MFSTRMVPVTSTVVFFSTTILRAELGNDAGIIGAALLGRVTST